MAMVFQGTASLGVLQSSAADAIAGFFAVVALFFLVVAIVVIAGMWKLFTKANEPGWAAIIPIYNFYVLLKIIGRPAWWLILMLIPVVNFVISILVYVELARSFGKGAGYAIGMVFLPFIFIPLLGFGSARYQGPVN